ncbi:sensor domain-containing diguanylate cyclase [Vibrio alfacsensis]|uniref:sensor domain-containing diguanylate cyclase n=1 Tax=Vibrio alfacsensis TaxID=1074311 RepID=UPI0040697415
MALPKFLIRFIRPYLLLLAGFIVYLSYDQLSDSESLVYRQSQTNLITANRLIQSHIEAAFSKFYLLESTLKANQHNPNSLEFTQLSNSIIDYSSQYSAVLYSDKNSPVAYRPSGHVALPDTTLLTWHKLNTLRDDFYVSSLYQNPQQRWVFAIKHIEPTLKHQLWLEFDLLHTTQQLRGLKTLSNGYVFVVERDTERLVFHPDPNRIGTPSVSYHGGISEKVDLGLLFGKHEYYYQDNFKLSVFDADNSMNWVFIAGTDRADIVNSSYPFALIAIVVASLLALAIGIHYLTSQLHVFLGGLNGVNNLGEFKTQLQRLLDRFCYHRGVQFCLYDTANHGVYTLDYHGNKKLVLTDDTCTARFSRAALTIRHQKYDDVLAKKLQISSKHYCMPLFDGHELMAVVYISCRFPIYKYVLGLIQSYAQIALTNLRLHERLRHQDPMTQLENKSCLATHIARELGSENRFVAMIDIDNFTYINEKHGYPVGDLVLKKTADVLREHFPKPKGLCLSRHSREEFMILFQANNALDAQQQLDHFRNALQNCHLSLGCGELRFTASIGFTPLEESYHHVIDQVDKALHQAKRLGKNRVIQRDAV